MHDLLDIAEFTCRDVAPFLPEDRQVNPDTYGAELAFWLTRSLAEEGIFTSYPASEDWGWYLDYQTDSGAEFAIHCGNVDGSRTRWALQIRRFGRKLFGRSKPSFEEAADLLGAIVRILQSDDAVSELELSWPS